MMMRRLEGKATTSLFSYLVLRALALSICGGLSLLFWQPATAQCTSVLRDGDFEAQRRVTVGAPWFTEGSAGIDIQKGLSNHGRNNAWIRNTNGWNAIGQTVHLSEGVTYTLKAFARTSAGVRDGYFGFRDARQSSVSELRFGPLLSYRELSVQFRPTRTGTYNIFAGVWAHNQDSWVQLDNVRVEFPCDDADLIPLDR
jgi:hypothetical protein